MYDFTVLLHSLLRWGILIVGFWIIIRSFLASRNNTPYEKLDSSLSLIMMAFCDTTLLIGLYQWFAGSWGIELLKGVGMGEVMKNATSRFFVIEHFTVMVFAIALIHIGRVLVKKKSDDKAKHATTWKFFAISIFLMLISIPWPFREVGLGRGWLF